MTSKSQPPHTTIPWPTGGPNPLQRRHHPTLLARCQSSVDFCRLWWSPIRYQCLLSWMMMVVSQKVRKTASFLDRCDDFCNHQPFCTLWGPAFGQQSPQIIVQTTFENPRFSWSSRKLTLWRLDYYFRSMTNMTERWLVCHYLWIRFCEQPAMELPRTYLEHRHSICIYIRTCGERAFPDAHLWCKPPVRINDTVTLRKWYAADIINDLCTQNRRYIEPINDLLAKSQSRRGEGLHCHWYICFPIGIMSQGKNGMFLTNIQLW